MAESSLIVRRLACVEWTPCASAGHIARHGLPIHPAELAEHNCLVYVRDDDCDEWRFIDESGRKSVHVSGNLRSSDPHALRAAALSDQGLILLPDAMVSEDLEAGRLVRVLSEYSAEQATIRAVYPSRRQLSLKVRTFLDYVAKAFAASPQTEFRTASVSSIGIGVAAQRNKLQNATQVSDYGSYGQLPCLPEEPRSVVASLATARNRKYFGTALSAT